MGIDRWTGFQMGQEVRSNKFDSGYGIVQDGLYDDEEGNLRVPVKWESDDVVTVEKAEDLS